MRRASGRRASIEREARARRRPAIVERVRWTRAIPPTATRRLAIEAVPERFDLKRDVFRALAAALAADALLATNTSSLSVAELADVVPHPRARARSAFFQSAGDDEAGRESCTRRRPRDEAIERAFAFVERIGKTRGARGRYAGIHRQSRRATVLPAVDARARARRRVRFRRARRAGARQPAFAWGRSS